MIALDTNVLVRYLVCDDKQQAEAARKLLESLTAERPGYVCREVSIELVWVLERTYGFPRKRIAAALENLTLSEHLVIENSMDVACSIHRYRQGGAEFSDLMILAAAERAGALPLYTFDRKVPRLNGVSLL